MKTAQKRHLFGSIALIVAFVCAFAFATTRAEAQTASFTTQMDIGARGSQVTALQTFLSMQTNFYPEGLITGYFGNLTSAAVARFQAFYGLPAVGRVGPLTLAKLNAIAGVGIDVSAPYISGTVAATSSTAATVSFMTNEAATGKVFYNAFPMTVLEAAGPGFAPVISGNVAAADANLRTAHTVMLSGLNPNTTYTYVVQAVDGKGNLSVTWPAAFRTNP